MTNNNQNQKPLYHISFSRITGTDDHGNDVLGRPKEIGAAWQRKGDKKGAIIQLDIVPHRSCHPQRCNVPRASGVI